MRMRTGLSSLPNNHPSAPCCGVTAVANITGEPFDKVWHMLSLRYGKTWKGTTWNDDLMWVIDALGWTYNTFQPARTNRFTLEEFTHSLALPNITYMVWTPGHVQVVRNKKVLDQSIDLFIERVPWRRKKVRRVLTLTSRKPIQTGALAQFL